MDLPSTRHRGRNDSVFHLYLRVQAHKSCSRHHFAYEYWTWQPQNGLAINDQGSRIPSHKQVYHLLSSPRIGAVYPIMPLLLAREASREASMEIPRWLWRIMKETLFRACLYDDWLAKCYYDEGEEDLHVQSATTVMIQLQAFQSLAATSFSSHWRRKVGIQLSV